MSQITVVDMHANEIQVTDLDAAIKQAKRLSNSPYKHHPFTLKGELKEDIKGRENEFYSVGEYNLDLSDKLAAVKQGSIVSSVVTTNAYGYKDYDIINHPLFHRAKVVPGIKKGDIFNAYYGRSSKMGVVWQGGLIKSLLMSGINETAYALKTHIGKNPTWEFHYGMDALTLAKAELERKGVPSYLEHSMTKEIYDLTLMVKGRKPITFKAENILANKDTLIDSVTWPVGVSEYKPRGLKAVLNMELSDIIVDLINSGETYKDDFVPGYSFELTRYSA